MSKLDRNYNLNGEYILTKDLDKKRFKISENFAPEAFYIFIEDNNKIYYNR